jgi:3-hydroxyisobutyrate dehydrogenase-like beta-hydroxyacid dehydrogenase
MAYVSYDLPKAAVNGRLTVRGPSVEAMTNVAFLGTGHMGAAMARRLLTTGHSVTVWNRTAAKAAALGEAGASVAATPADAVRDATLVITMLADAAAVTSALFDSGAQLREGSTVAQMSTVGPDETRTLAARIPAGVTFVDAPVAGSVDAAESGKLTVFTGGEVPADAAAVLGDLGTVRDCGAIGAATGMKLVVNTALLTALGGLRDALAVAEALGVRDPLAALGAGPVQGVVARASSTTASFAVGLAAKDLRLAVRELKDAPVASAVLELLESFPDRDADVAAITHS